MITSDDRVAEVIEEAAKVLGGKSAFNVPFDLVVTPLATGSKDYIEWVKLQTQAKSSDTAFYNERADPAMKARTEKVGEVTAIQIENKNKFNEKADADDDDDEGDEE